MTTKVTPLMPNKLNSSRTVKPLDGWKLHSPYGALQDLERRPLERLEAMHAFLMKRDGLTSMDAAARVFGPFLADANSEIGMSQGADRLRSFLMVCDRSDKAYSLFPVGKYADRSYLERLGEVVPYVVHHHFDRGTPEALLYALGQMAGEVWAPLGGDFDLNDRPCAAFGTEGYFPSVAAAREILGPFAVRHDLANKLWGWGVVDDVVSPAVVVPGLQLSAEFLAMCQRRKKGDSWTDADVRILITQSAALPREGGAAAMAKALGTSVTNVNKQLQKKLEVSPFKTSSIHRAA